MTGRILALDVGNRRIGVALSDPLRLTAQGLPTITRMRLEADLEAIMAIVEEYEVAEIVVGMPRNMDGSLGSQARQVQRFCKRLEPACQRPVHTWDERLTSVSARRAAVAQGVKTGHHKDKIDRIAAQFILEGYLAYRRNTEDSAGS